MSKSQFFWWANISIMSVAKQERVCRSSFSCGVSFSLTHTQNSFRRLNVCSFSRRYTRICFCLVIHLSAFLGLCLIYAAPHPWGCENNILLMMILLKSPVSFVKPGQYWHLLALLFFLTFMNNEGERDSFVQCPKVRSHSQTCYLTYIYLPFPMCYGPRH